MTVHLPDFDALKAMAEHSPERLEQLRLELAETTIEAAPAHCQHRLRGLQFEIDSQRKLCKSPLAACIRISSMMHDTFEELRDELNRRSTPEPIAIAPTSAKVLDFRPH